VAVTIEEKINTLKTNRTLAINSKVGISAAKIDKGEEDELGTNNLWGVAPDIGLQSLIKLYLQERSYEAAKAYAWPALSSFTKSGWETISRTALNGVGDTVGLEGLYPNDPSTGAAATELNTGSEYLNAYGESAGNTNITDLQTAISDLEAQRVIDPIYYSNPEKAAFLSALTVLLDSIKGGAPLRTKLAEIRAEIDKIKNENPVPNNIFKEVGMDADVDNDIANIDAYIVALDAHVGDPGDNLPFSSGDNPTTLHGFFNWFDNATGSEGQFDTNLNNLGTLVVSINTTINNRLTSVDASLGAKVALAGGYPPGPPNPPTFTKLRKWQYFWINSRIGKPQATLIDYKAMEGAITDADKKLTNANNELAILFGSTPADKETYIPTLTFILCYANHKRDAVGVVTDRRIGMAWTGQQHATEYLIQRRKLVSNLGTVANVDWGDPTYATVNTLDPETNMIKIVYMDEDPTFAQSEMFVYRVRIRDTVNDSFDSGSVESKIYDDTKEVNFTITNATTIELATDHGLSKARYIVVKNTVSSDGYYYISALDENTATVWPALQEVAGTGKAYPCPSVFFIFE